MGKNNTVQGQVSDEEWRVRVDLAACYRAIAMYGWDDLIFTHISARVPGPDEHFLINAYGMLFEEMTASSLIKVDLNGEKILDSPYPINPAGFVIHSAVHEARHDVACVLHTHTKAGIAVSAQADGLLPLSQISLFVLSPWVTTTTRALPSTTMRSRVWLRTSAITTHLFCAITAC